jgi:hypothetical protein
LKFQATVIFYTATGAGFLFSNKMVAKAKALA